MPTANIAAEVPVSFFSSVKKERIKKHLPNYLNEFELRYNTRGRRRSCWKQSGPFVCGTLSALSGLHQSRGRLGEVEEKRLLAQFAP